MKFATNICHLSGNCWKGFQGQRWKVRVMCIQMCKCCNDAGIYFGCVASRLTCLLLFYCHCTSIVVSAIIAHPITKAFLQVCVEVSSICCDNCWHAECDVASTHCHDHMGIYAEFCGQICFHGISYSGSATPRCTRSNNLAGRSTALVPPCLALRIALLW